MKLLVILLIVKLCAQTDIFKSKIALTQKVEIMRLREVNQPAVTYAKLVIEILEQGVR